jgi:hypothetical protein
VLGKGRFEYLGSEMGENMMEMAKEEDVYECDEYRHSRIST